MHMGGWDNMLLITNFNAISAIYGLNDSEISLVFMLVK